MSVTRHCSPTDDFIVGGLGYALNSSCSLDQGCKTFHVLFVVQCNISWPYCENQISEIKKKISI